MLVEIPDPEVILGVILAFVVGLVSLYGYYKVQSFIKSKSEVSEVSQSERLEYYERQLIDMKIRLDALEIQGIEQKVEDPNLELKQFLEKLAKNEVQERKVKETSKPEDVPEKPVSAPSITSIDHTNPTDYVLHLITDKAMTSRDIQITLKRSREHTSRLMKRLFEDGFVQRNTETKPYTYSITEKGKAKVKEIQINSIIA
ncbi:MAG: MarR family transcriptional regulator [Nitrosopumilus sp.]|nr:MarR family transcriptional regulator [Nitrosopumilus sp.]MDH3822198.1 MarR family transcriptional regulator [Nitrosopumilus sp.]MDH3833759.1 MarR family transcriptional regulator [Nitrosopumilus sp.]